MSKEFSFKKFSIELAFGQGAHIVAAQDEKPGFKGLDRDGERVKEAGFLPGRGKGDVVEEAMGAAVVDILSLLCGNMGGLMLEAAC